jgi:hypothetical protein
VSGGNFADHHYQTVEHGTTFQTEDQLIIGGDWPVGDGPTAPYHRSGVHRQSAAAQGW